MAALSSKSTTGVLASFSVMCGTMVYKAHMPGQSHWPVRMPLFEIAGVWHKLLLLISQDPLCARLLILLVCQPCS